MTGFPMASWFSYGRFSVLAGGKGGGGEREREKSYRQMKINYPSRSLQLCGQV